MPHWSCAACAVEYPVTDDPPERCAICDDDRQYVPLTGQAWFSREELIESGTKLQISLTEPHLYEISTEPMVGIGQHSFLIVTSEGNLLWDPTGFVDEKTAQGVRDLGGANYIVASHPHMYGAQVAWSHALGGATVLVAEADQRWVQRTDAVIETFSGDRELLPGVKLRTLGGHFPGSLVAYWKYGAEGRGVMLAGDSFFPAPDGRSVTFMHSFPNGIPLSAAVVDRVASAALRSHFDRLYGNFGAMIEADAHAVVRRSADRYMAWVRGDFDHLT